MTTKNAKSSKTDIKTSHSSLRSSVAMHTIPLLRNSFSTTIRHNQSLRPLVFVRFEFFVVKK